MHWRLDKYVCVVCDGFTQEIIKVREWIPHTGLLTKVIFSNMVPSPSADITRAMHGQEKWRSRNYNPRQKSWHAYPLLQYLSEKFISSPPSPRFNVIYRDVFVIARFQHCRGGGGGGGFFIPGMSLVIASKYLVNACSSYLIQTCQRLLSWIVPETNWRERHCVCFDFVSCQRCFMPSQPSFSFGETFVSFFLVRAFIQF